MTTRRDALELLIRRAESAGWAGADPYDGLDSFLGRVAIPLGPLARIAVTQSVLRSARVRGWVRPRPSANPKGLALFLGAVARGRRLVGEERARSLGGALIARLRENRVEGRAGIGWGYPFPWQSRYFFAPAGTPNAVVTATVGWQLLEAAEAFGDDAARVMAEGAATFLLDGLHWTDLGSGASAVSYTPNDRSQVVNVAGLVARLLARLGHAAAAGRLASFVVRSQNGRGGWNYSSEARGGWEDSFHTGFVLESLLDLRSHAQPVSADVLRRGFSAYRRFFDADGGARLYNAPSSPHDAHSAAQGIVTYAAAASVSDGLELAGHDPIAMAGGISDWAMRRLWIPEEARFAYRWSAAGRDDRDYLRWVQGWMSLALAELAAVEPASARDRDMVRSA